VVIDYVKSVCFSNMHSLLLVATETEQISIFSIRTLIFSKNVQTFLAIMSLSRKTYHELQES